MFCSPCRSPSIWRCSLVSPTRPKVIRDMTGRLRRGITIVRSADTTVHRAAPMICDRVAFMMGLAMECVVRSPRCEARATGLVRVNTSWTTRRLLRRQHVDQVVLMALVARMVHEVPDKADQAAPVVLVDQMVGAAVAPMVRVVPAAQVQVQECPGADLLLASVALQRDSISMKRSVNNSRRCTRSAPSRWRHSMHELAPVATR